MRHVVRIVSANEHGKIARVEVIGMAVRNQAVFNLRPVEFIFLIMRHGIGVEIDEDFVVYKRLRAGTKIFSAERERAPARFALTEQSGNALIGSRAEILDFHEIFLLGKIVCPPGAFLRTIAYYYSRFRRRGQAFERKKQKTFRKTRKTEHFVTLP